MVQILPQQQLLLELLILSGDIAAPRMPQNAVLKRTMDECLRKGWITQSNVNTEFANISITASGRSVVETTTGA